MQSAGVIKPTNTENFLPLKAKTIETASCSLPSYWLVLLIASQELLGRPPPALKTVCAGSPMVFYRSVLGSG